MSSCCVSTSRPCSSSWPLPRLMFQLPTTSAPRTTYTVYRVLPPTAMRTVLLPEAGMLSV